MTVGLACYLIMPMLVRDSCVLEVFQMKRIVYVGSFDPAHIGHLNTYQKATRILCEHITPCVCCNELKPQGLFALSERVAIAKALFDTDEIQSFTTYQEIRHLIETSDLIVRGYRKKDMGTEKNYSLRLLSHYGLEDLRERLFFVEIDEAYEGISSSAIRQLIKHDISSAEKFFNEASFAIVQNILSKR